ncbi:MAG TPA: type II toxin-antitoxin system VapC family toxin [Nocardioidaceae bacterium]|nr:type II toxin-antitoxin system VapC family toxin [Nocardioidaceae bacterium]
MILVDTSIWIDHLRAGDPELVGLLQDGHVLAHPWVIGELALGHLSRRGEILGLLHNLPQATVATDLEVLTLIENQHLFGLGIGYVDAHLLAATLLTPDARLWTRDKRLATIAVRDGLGSHHNQGT